MFLLLPYLYQKVGEDNATVFEISYYVCPQGSSLRSVYRNFESSSVLLGYYNYGDNITMWMYECIS